MKILIAGDFAPMARLAKKIENKRFPEVFPSEIRDVIQSADFSFVNFESPIVENGYKPIPKCGPNLKCSEDAAGAVRYAGFTGVTLANNHILDYGADGLRKTVECCRNQGLVVVGVGDNLEDAGKVLYLNKNGETLAVINCCEHEFSIATDTEAGANPLNPVRQFYRIQEAKDHADYVLVIVHGGHEHFQLPSPRMVETYRFFIDSGADAVVNHHQHCYSGFEWYKSKPIFYGLGNFCFDIAPVHINTTWNYGYMVEITLVDKVETKILPYNQCGQKALVDLLQADAFDYRLKELNEMIKDEKLLNSKFDDYYLACVGFEDSCLEPYSGRIMGKLYSMGFVPGFIHGKKASLVLNHVECESHRDKLLYALKRKVNKHDINK